MRKKEGQVQMSLGLPEDFKREIERISKKRDMSQQKVILMMLDLGIEIHKEMEKVGIVAAVDFLYFVKKTMKERLKSNKPIQLELPL